MALGQLGLRPHELQYYTLRTFSNALHGTQEVQEQNERREWERTRWLATVLLSPHLKHPLRSPQDLVKFDWEVDTRQVDQLLTREEVAAIFGDTQ